jgi:RNA polymerase primary sigma factor
MARHDEREESHDLLNHYLQEIARVPLLTPERERELGQRIQAGDKAALEELVKANLRFVVSYARKYRNTHVHFLDLINEGNIGLIQAAKKYDPEKNVRFVTYAVWWIRQCILHALSEQAGAYRMPSKRANLMYRLERAIGASTFDGNSVPTHQELATELGVSVKEVQLLMQTSSDNYSLNAPLDDESSSELADVIEQTSVPSVEDEMQRQSRRKELLAHISCLNPKERLVITLRHGISDNVPKRLVEVGAVLERPSVAVDAVITAATQKACGALGISESELAALLLYTSPNPKAWWRFWYELGDLTPSMSPQIDRARVKLLEEITQQGLVQKTLEERLSVEERTLLKMRYGILQDDELNLKDIAEVLHLSRERVRQIEQRAEAKCRRNVRRDR